MVMLLVTGTDHPIPHLYDINTFKCYLPPNFQEIGVNSAINQVNLVSSMLWSEGSSLFTHHYISLQVRYSSTGGMYVTASKDGAIRLWDGVIASCVRSIDGAHGAAEATSANFTKDQRLEIPYSYSLQVRIWTFFFN